MDMLCARVERLMEAIRDREGPSNPADGRPMPFV
jgi:hypothetical protein